MIFRALILPVVAAFAFCLSTVAHAKTNETFRVMTFNIHHGEGIDGKLDFERIAKLIRQEKADLVALQEVDKGIARSKKLDVGAEIARLAGMTCVFSNNQTFAGGEYGNAILSRFPVKSRDHRLLPQTDSTERRGWLQAVVDVNGKKISFWNTHIDHRKDNTERLLAVEKFNGWIAEEKLPVIFCGDFNSTPESPTHEKMEKYFDDSWAKVGKGPGNTIPVKNPNHRIDYIWVSKNAPFEPVSAWVPETVASDHLPVVVEFRWK